MSCFIGIDVGTSSTKSLILGENGCILGVAQKKYGVIRPNVGWAEQDINELWEACCATLRELSEKYPGIVKDIKCAGYSGQMHGLVMLDENNKPLRNVIIWEDQRSVTQIEKINSIIGEKNFCETTLNRLSTGYLITSLIWVRDNEPEIFKRVKTIMLPKDYIRFRMCGKIACDMSDASASVIFDTAKRSWAWEIIDRLNLPRSIFPECHESHEIAGHITREAAELTGLPEGTPLVYGGGDTLMHEVGTCMIDESRPWVANIGTSCQVTCAMNSPKYDSDFRTNTFCHVKKDLWMLMSCNLCGGAAMRWLTQHIFDHLTFEELNALAEQAPAGSNGVIFLPYLNGARSPDVDPRAKGMFIGLSLSHHRYHIARSTMEGVIYSLRNAYETLKSVMKSEPDRIIASGGGARGELILQMEADIIGKPVYTTVEAEQACIGAALSAAVGAGFYSSYSEACDSVVKFNSRVVEPIEANRRIYDEYFAIYRKLYSANKEIFESYPEGL